LTFDLITNIESNEEDIDKLIDTERLPLEDDADDSAAIITEMDEEGHENIRAATLNKLVRHLTSKSTPGKKAIYHT
jgi:hypothetical protein